MRGEIMDVESLEKKGQIKLRWKILNGWNHYILNLFESVSVILFYGCNISDD